MASIVSVQIYLASSVYKISVIDALFDIGFAYSSRVDERNPLLDHTIKLPKGFGACIMVKDDNDLLYEWIAYHYTVLPLHYLVVGSDIDGTQDPAIVLNRWTEANITDLKFWILQPTDFIYRHGYRGNGSQVNARAMMTNESEAWKLYHHHLFVDRQKAFVTACTEILKKVGVDWTLYIDSDEFVVWNPWTTDEELRNFTVGGSGLNSISSKSLQIRKEFASLIPIDERTQFYPLVRHLQNSGDISDCYTLPRLLVGALENRTCPVQYAVQSVQRLARTQLHERFEHMSTLRFFQHAQKGDFSRSKFGKVMMDLSKISDATIRSELPRNIHRPYTKHCGPAGAVHFPNTLFYLLHYVGSWERYSARNDYRRDRFEFEKRAFVSEDMSACASTVHHWYLQFCRLVGEKNLPFLLGGVAPK